jgi:hypothetical protein
MLIPNPNPPRQGLDFLDWWYIAQLLLILLKMAGLLDSTSWWQIWFPTFAIAGLLLLHAIMNPGDGRKM